MNKKNEPKDDSTVDDALPFESKKTKNRLSEVRVAEMFIEQHGDDFRYVAPWKKWFKWDGKRWREEPTQDVGDLIKKICVRQGRSATSNAEVRSLLKNSFITGAESIAKRDRKIAATVDQWDKDPFLLNTPGGVVDLKTGKVQENQRENYMTKITGAAPDWNCATPTWDAHLVTIFTGDRERIDFFHRLLGHCLTGDVSEDIVVFCHGEGGSGKTTTVELILAILGDGDYGEKANMEMFLASRHGHGHPTELTILRGARLVLASEPDKGSKFSEARVKSLTGGGRITARGMRQDFYTFTPTHKIMFEGEHPPSLTTVDAGWRRRIIMIVFAKIAERVIDKQFSAKLMQEAPGILAKMVDGCLEWQRGGLRPPKSVTEATSDYLSKQDRTKEWFEECVEVDPNGDGAHTTDLYASYKLFMMMHGEIPVVDKVLVEELEARATEFKIKREGSPFFITDERGQKKRGRGFRGIGKVWMPGELRLGKIPANQKDGASTGTPARDEIPF